MDLYFFEVSHFDFNPFSQQLVHGCRPPLLLDKEFRLQMHFLCGLVNQNARPLVPQLQRSHQNPAVSEIRLGMTGHCDESTYHLSSYNVVCQTQIQQNRCDLICLKIFVGVTIYDLDKSYQHRWISIWCPGTHTKVAQDMSK